MYKLVVLCCLLVSCFADPSGLQSLRRRDRGCSDRSAGRAACASSNSTDALAPHPYDCRLFFYCRNGGAPPACRRCAGGLHFNPELHVCDWPQHANCSARPPRPPRPSSTTESADSTASDSEPSSTTESYPGSDATDGSAGGSGANDGIGGSTGANDGSDGSSGATDGSGSDSGADGANNGGSDSATVSFTWPASLSWINK